jgi:PAS domain S-box-containing protein
MQGIKTLNVAIVGGGPGCQAIMDMIFAEKLSQLRMTLIGVACSNPEAVGYRYARKKGVYTAKDYRDFYELKDLDMIIELTGRDEVAQEISHTKPDHIRLVDHVAARLFWDIFQIEEQRIAERRIADEARKESEERLKAILDTIHAGVVLIDAETHTIVDVNPIAAELIGAPKDKIVGHVCHTFICPAQEGRCPITDLGQTVDKGERVLINAQRQSIPILKTVTPMVLAGRKYLIDSFIDLTERKHLEAQFQQAQKMQAIGTLAGGIAHDFNNLLTAIQGYTDLIAMDIRRDHAQFNNLKEIERAVGQGTDLTKQLLGFARGGKYEVKLTNLNKLIAQGCETYGRTHKEIKIHTKLQGGIWPVRVDRAQIEQVLLNLYVNAWQAMPDGGDLYVETDNVVLDQDYTTPFEATPGNYVKISVTDTGIGMDKETQQRVFDPFFTTKEVDRGTGLGLSSAYGIIKNHGGLISVYSELGRGSTFNIYLPASDGPFQYTKTPSAEKEEVLTGRETVLVVDDEDMVLSVAGKILKKMGYNVWQAKSGREAIEIYGKHRNEIDLIILDMVMPDIGGGETYDILKSVDTGVKVLLSSGYSIDGQASKILDRGCDGFIQKPFKVKELSGKIRQILDNHLPNG